MTPRRFRPQKRRTSAIHARPLIAFLLIASFGILFAGCGRSGIRGPEDVENSEEFTFTEDDVARFRDLADEEGEQETGTGEVLDIREVEGTSSISGEPPVLDLSMADTYESIRSGPGATGGNLYRVTNEFFEVRDAANVTAGNVARLDQGDLVTVVELMNAAWAKIEYAPGKQGYVALRYLSKVTSEEKLANEKKAFDGLYFVNFGFVNVRKEPNAQSEKLGEIPGQSLIKPISKDEVWARVPFQGKEGYVAMQYLSPFMPNFLVRQEQFSLPTLHYNMDQKDMGTLLVSHVHALREQGMKLLTYRDFYDLLLTQERRDVRLEPKTVIIALSGVTPENVKEVTDLLSKNNIRATLFLQTQHIGLSGITEKQLLTMQANGLDIESAGHTGDDLRSLTNAQVELELKQSRKIIEDVTKKTVFVVAYPEGGVNDRVMEKAVEAGYLLGVGSSPERTFTRSQFLRLPSFIISSSMQPEDIITLVKP